MAGYNGGGGGGRRRRRRRRRGRERGHRARGGGAQGDDHEPSGRANRKRILDHRRQRANWWGIGARSMCPPRLFRDGVPCRRTRLVRPPSFLVTAEDEQVLVYKVLKSIFHNRNDA